MSENDFYLLNGNQYRGSRYANFADSGGLDAQGNVSTVSSSLPASAGNGGNGQVAVAQQQAAAAAPPNFLASPPNFLARKTNISSINTPPSSSVNRGSTSIGGTSSSGGGLGAQAISGALPFIGRQLGSGIGSAVASGIGANSASKFAVGGLASKVSGGLLGTSSSVTNAALSGLGSKLGPATAAQVGRAAAGGSAGAALGNGFATAAATLLTGGSIKDAAISGIGAGVGLALGNLILPGIGGIVGSILGSFASKLFGGGREKRITAAGSSVVGDDGLFKPHHSSGRGVSPAVGRELADTVSSVLNTFSSAIGFKYNKGYYFNIESNLKRDAKTVLNSATSGGDQVISGKTSDVDAAALNILRRPRYYTLGEDKETNDFWTGAVSSATSTNELGNTVDAFFTKRQADLQNKALQNQALAAQALPTQASPSLIAYQNKGQSRFSFAS